MREELIRKIEAAFADVPYPGDDHIGHRETDILIGQKDWQKVPLALLRHLGDDFLLLFPKGFHFYLPAFINAALSYPDEFQLEDLIVFSLTPHPSTYTYRSTSEQALQLFTPSQKSTIVEFLEMCPTLFPFDSFSQIDEAKAELQRAIQFWKES